ncbi:MAG: TlpA family protein disulfide reductase [Bacteroidales bacterium]|nr:TlpA family protein disulfide reductase [Bacteroidales bacterium]
MAKTTLFLMLFMLTAGFSEAQKSVPVYDFDAFKPLLHRQNDTTYVINFWATWCKPCVEELPAFETLNENHKNEKVRVMLVSLDFIRHYDSKLIPFIEERSLQSKVILLNDPRSNSWIDQVSPEWSGAIPATLIYRGNMRQFYERSFTILEIEKELENFIRY